MAKLRLSTEGRFMLSGFSPEALVLLRQSQWLVAGNLAHGESLVLIPVKLGGLKVAKDGRLHVAHGQAKFGAKEEMVLKEELVGDHIKLTVEEREIPAAEKILHMIARPTKPAGEAKPDPGEMHLFADFK